MRAFKMRMPSSTSSAVETPFSSSPSSTRVMATAGCMPTTTVSASMIEAIAATSLSMRPVNESTISSSEISINRACAPVRSICSRARCCISITVRSSMSDWIETISTSPTLRMGTLNAFIAVPLLRARLGVAARVDRHDALPCQLEGQPDAVAQLVAGDDTGQVYAEVNNGLRDGRADAGDDAGRAEQAHGGHGLNQVIRHLRVDGRHAGDVEDGDLGARLDDALKQALHHQLRAAAVERADQRQADDAIPDLHDGRRQLQHILLLLADDALALLDRRYEDERAEFVERFRYFVDLIDQQFGIVLILVTQEGQQRFFQAEDIKRRLRWTESLGGARFGDFQKQAANRIELFAAHLFGVGVGDGRDEGAQKGLRIMAQLFAADQRLAEIRR